MDFPKASYVQYYKYCTQCSDPLSKTRKTGQMKCDQGHMTYVTSFSVGAAFIPVMHDDRVHLVATQRNIPPGVGLWCLPGGYTKPGKTSRAGTALEIVQETNIKTKASQLKYVTEASAFIQADPNARVLTFYERDPVSITQVDFNFKDKQKEVQALTLVKLNKKKNGLLDIYNNPIEFCFPSHHKLSIRQLKKLETQIKNNMIADPIILPGNNFDDLKVA